MASIPDAASWWRRRPAVRAAIGATLFPELAGGRSRLIEGILRAPPRDRLSPPLLSASARDGDASGPAATLGARGWEDPALLTRAAAARRALVAARVGGAWWEPGAAALAGVNLPLAVLAERGVAGREAPADAALRIAPLDAAQADRPDGRIAVYAPQPLDDRARRAVAAARDCGAVVIDRLADPWTLIDGAARIYTAGGEIGFLALLAGVPVTALADAAYTGWGATDDAPGVRQHAPRRSVDEIFVAICLVATRYRDPFRDAAASFEDTVALLADWRRLDAANRRIAVCVGMSFWKRRRIADFVRSSAGVPVFRRTAAAALAAVRVRPGEPPGAIAGWASRLPEGLVEAAAREAIPLIRVEDGFIRSVGLGSDFLPPASAVFDASGMYYDPRQCSDLEHLLLENDFPPALLARAERLVARLVARGITKYNLAASAPSFEVPAGRRRILVPGQVEDDLSIRFGAGPVRTNLGLLAAVRAANPDAFVVYKPHPDVLAGHRIGAVPDAEARRFADAVAEGGSTAALIDTVDELHTMTSLAGFEARLRGRRVVVYGRPFYAGWGLTEDMPPFERGRRLSLAELAAGALILYPRYLDPLTRLPCGPEVIIERLDRPELWRPGPLVMARRLQGAASRRLAGLRALLPGPRSGAARVLRERHGP